MQNVIAQKYSEKQARGSRTFTGKSEDEEQARSVTDKILLVSHCAPWWQDCEVKSWKSGLETEDWSTWRLFQAKKRPF